MSGYYRVEEEVAYYMRFYNVTWTYDDLEKAQLQL